MSMLHDEVIEAIDRIKKVLSDYAPAVDNQNAKRLIRKETAFIEQRLPFISEKCAGLRTWADELYSPRKWAKYGSVDKVKLFMYHDCASIESAVTRRDHDPSKSE